MSNRDRRVAQLQHHMDGAQTSSLIKIIPLPGKRQRVTVRRFSVSPKFDFFTREIKPVIVVMLIICSLINAFSSLVRKKKFLFFFQIKVFIFDCQMALYSIARFILAFSFSLFKWALINQIQLNEVNCKLFETLQMHRICFCPLTDFTYSTRRKGQSTLFLDNLEPQLQQVQAKQLKSILNNILQV